MKISILIATYNRGDDLNNIIELLENQSIDRDEYEIIVTDSFSSDNTINIIDKLCNKYNNIVYKNDCKNILANKRNEGIKLAKSDIIVFLDDDVYPYDRFFLENHYNANIDNEDSFFSGQIRFESCKVNSSNYFRFRDDQHLKNIKNNQVLEFNKIVVMNLSFKRKFINDVGYVDERFINYGCEDTEFGYRIYKKGYKIKYLENALAIHKEASKNIVEYSKKIIKNKIYGKKTLYSICQDIKDLLPYSRFDNKSFVNSLLFNKLFLNITKLYLLITDKIRLFYNYYIYKYYLFCVSYHADFNMLEG